METSSADHEFGSVSTDLKLQLIDEYLRAFTTALKPIFRELWYIDAFAGTGRRTVRIAAREANLLEDGADETVEQRRGSAQIAIDCQPAFNRLIFIDLKRTHARALNELKTKHETSTLKIDVIREDANVAIKRIIEEHSFSGTRAVMFLDPYGMHLSWETLEAIAETGAIDVWYFVPLVGLFRQAAKDSKKITEKKRAAITRMLGTPGWERDWYRLRREPDMFGEDPSAERVADVDAIEKYVMTRLQTIFSKVLPPLRLNNRGGVPAFSLFFAISNRKPKAIGLATRIADHILNSGRSSQRRLR